MVFVELENQRLLGKHANHFKNIKASLKGHPFDKAWINNILYFAFKYLKRTFEKSHVKSGPSIMVVSRSIY